MKSGNVFIDGKRMHFLYDGSGPPVILLHASPLSSKSCIPLLNQLSARYTVIAVDTPGYGQSDPPPTAPTHITYYASKLKSFIEALRIKKCAIYGTATGAQIGIRFALMYPENIDSLFLDNTAHFTTEEKEKIIASYFPSFQPVANGQHLSDIWYTVTHLFKYFPWCFQEEKYKLTGSLPPLHILHSIFLDYLSSGVNYDWAYRVAFEHEDRKNIYDLKIPTHIFRWENSILKKYMDRIFEGNVPSNVISHSIGSDEDRFAAMSQLMKTKYTNSDSMDYSLPIVKDIIPESIHHPVGLPPFPSITSSGDYLIEAWNLLDDFISKGTGIEEKNQIFLNWAKHASIN